MLGLLEPYLKHPWAVSETGPFDLWMVNVDALNVTDYVPDMESRIVRCAARPKDQPGNAIHRPLRPSEVLTVLSEAAPRLLAQEDGSAVSQGYLAVRLRRWPLDFETWPRLWWRVLACVARNTSTPKAIAERTRVPLDQVNACVVRLIAEQWVDIVTQHAADAPVHSGFRQKWSALASRLFQRLGLSK